MSQPQNKPNEIDADLLAITNDELIRYFAAKGVKSECPSCDQNDWKSVPPNPYGLVRLDVQKTTDLMIGGPHVPATVLVCGNCGFIKMHSLMLIKNWLDQEKKSAAG